MNGGAVAIILARGGSKGLPRKNALPVAGRPCIEWTIEHAIEARSVGPIIVSTDDEELLGIARSWSEQSGGRVVPVVRPSELATDTSTVDAAARGALVEYEARTLPFKREEAGGVPRKSDPIERGAPAAPALRLSPTHPIVILYGNVPVRPRGLVDRAVETLVRTGADSVQSYAPVGKHHPWWMTRVDPETGEVRPWEGDVLNHGVFRRQDLPPAHIPDGGVIVVTREALMLEIDGVRPGPHAFFGRQERRCGVVNAEGAVVDIDTRTDMLVAEAILKEQGAPHAHR